MRRMTVEIIVDLEDDEMIRQIDVVTECPTGTHVHSTTKFKIVNFWPLNRDPSSLQNEPSVIEKTYSGPTEFHWTEGHQLK